MFDFECPLLKTVLCCLFVRGVLILNCKFSAKPTKKQSCSGTAQQGHLGNGLRPSNEGKAPKIEHKVSHLGGKNPFYWLID